MICPFCNTENRDDLDQCYHCNKDLSMLRLIINKAKHHYNVALEHAERGRYYEAIVELQNVLELDSKNVNAYVVLGTIYAKQNQFDKATEYWEKALNVDNRFLKAHDYILKSEKVKESLPFIRWFKILLGTLLASFVIIIFLIAILNKPDKRIIHLNEAFNNYSSNDLIKAKKTLDKVISTKKDVSINISRNLLEKAIKNEIELTKTKVQLAIKDNLPYEAVKLLNGLKNKNPDESVISWINAMEKTILESLIVQIKRNLDVFEAQDGYPEDLSNAIETFRTAFPNQKEGSELYQNFINLMKKKF